MTKNNSGINTSGGNVIATNMAVGDGATINISGDMRVNIARELDAIRDILGSTDLPAEQKKEMTAAVDELASETVADKADETKVSAALNVLERATKIGGGLVDFGVKLAPHVAALAGFLL